MVVFSENRQRGSCVNKRSVPVARFGQDAEAERVPFKSPSARVNAQFSSSFSSGC